ncbi:unnamed protein product [Rangifer tarandus platyrhynchus]
MVTALGEDAQVLSPAQRLASQELSGREGGLSPGSVATCLWMAGSDAQRLWLQRRKEPAFASCFLLPLPPPSDPPCLSSNLPGRCGAWPLLEMSGPAPSTLQRETGPTVPCLPLEWVLVEDAEAGGKGKHLISTLGVVYPSFLVVRCFCLPFVCVLVVSEP